jgi:hypothetical protein
MSIHIVTAMIAVTVPFVAFAAVLFWADLQTRGLRR